MEFRQFLNEMLVHGEGKQFVAFRGHIWLFDTDDDKVEKVAKNIISVIRKEHPNGKELIKLFAPKKNGYDIHNVEGFIRDYIPDAIAGHFYNNTVSISDNRSSPKTSLLIKKVVDALGATHVSFNDLKPNSDEKDYKRPKSYLKGNFNVTWYHGTTSEYLHNILRFGLQPGQSESNYGKRGVFHDDKVFLTARFWEAMSHAQNAVLGSSTYRKTSSAVPVVIAINPKGLDPALILPDYDVDREANKKYYKPSIKDKNNKQYSFFSVDSDRAGKFVGLIGYQGRIPASQFGEVYFWNSYTNKLVRVKDINKLLSYLKHNDLTDRYGSLEK